MNYAWNNCKVCPQMHILWNDVNCGVLNIISILTKSYKHFSTDAEQQIGGFHGAANNFEFVPVIELSWLKWVHLKMSNFPYPRMNFSVTNVLYEHNEQVHELQHFNKSSRSGSYSEALTAKLLCRTLNHWFVSHQCFYAQAHVPKRLCCNASCQETSRCGTRGESEESKWQSMQARYQPWL